MCGDIRRTRTISPHASASNSRTHIQRILKRLEAKGLIQIEPYKPRGIKVIKQELRAAA
jgi:DNA-binding GntR family transcriptional regulator